MNNNQTDKPIMTIDEVADLLRVHRSTVTKYALSLKIKSHLIGNRRLFKREDVWAFFDNQVAREFISGKEH